MSEAAPTPSPAPEAKPAEAKPAEAKPAAVARPLPAFVVPAGAAVGALLVGAMLGVLVLGPVVVRARNAAAAAAAARPAKEKRKDASKTGLFKLDNIIVNPAGSAGTRFLMTTVAFELPDEKLQEVMKSHEVEIRDRVVTVLEGCSMDLLTQAGARDTLRARIRLAVDPVVRGEVPSYSVYMPQFVIQ